MPSPAAPLSPQVSVLPSSSTRIISASLRSRPSRERTAFTLIELLVVIAIIAILAGLGFAGVNGALKTAKKTEVRGMANQIKLAIGSYYAEYGTYPNIASSDANFLSAMTGATNVPTIPNRRGIRFLEVPPKFTNATGIITPARFYKDGSQRAFSIMVDTNYDGRITLPGASQEATGTIAVYVEDPDKSTNYIGTW